MTAAATPPPSGADTSRRVRRTLRLTKHHGLGNDFLVALAAANPDVDLPAVAGPGPGAALARRLCDRRRGIGADGLIFALPGDEDGIDAVMVLFNADGSRAEMSGNGVRCLAQALAAPLAEHATVHTTDLAVRTDAGLRRLCVRPADADADASTVEVTVDMGPVRPGPHWNPSADARAGLHAATGGHDRLARSADIGNPHLVIAVDDPWSIDVARLGPLLEADFAEGINVQFIAPRPGAANNLDLTVWERGAGVTEACGTGAAAAATVAQRWALVASPVTVHMPGGTVRVIVGEGSTELIGPATYIGTIEVELG